MSMAQVHPSDEVKDNQRLSTSTKKSSESGFSGGRGTGSGSWNKLGRYWHAVWTFSGGMRPRSPNAEAPVGLSDKDAEEKNIRMLATSVKFTNNCFVIPKEQPVPLLLLRLIFTRLRDQCKCPPASTPAEETLPFEAFRRAFERLFFILQDPDDFDAKSYDENGDGFVAWEEFFHVYKKRNIRIKLSLCERIFLTLDNPDSSYLAQIVSALVMLTIIVSSVGFIVSTLPEFQVESADGTEPRQAKVFARLDEVCLAFFVIEYFARLATCWTARSELFDKHKLLDLVIGYQKINVPSPAERIIRFVLTPSNFIDLAAILPALVLSLHDTEADGSGFIVLRLVRLSRIGRVFKIPALVEPVMIIGRTVQQSTRALYVLGFNLLLGIVISGSLMYLAEGQSRWDPQTRTYVRKMWDDDGVEVWESTPFQSIPHAFWWAIVTVTTVGYGDHYPTTPLGYLITVATLIFSVVILALPVGVIGGTFSQVWSDFDQERRRDAENLRHEMVFITSSIQRLDPSTMSQLMLLEVWNDQGDTSGLNRRGNPSQFMGEATVHLDLHPETPVSRQYTVPLEESTGVRRHITGHITVRYSWTPDRSAKTKQTWEELTDGQPKACQLRGTLQVTALSADNLINLDFARASLKSSPYCTILVYPQSPGPDGALKPWIWRTNTEVKNLYPKWRVHGCTIVYNWNNSNSTDHVQALIKRRPPTSTETSGKERQPLHEVLGLIRDLSTELRRTREEVKVLSEHVDQIARRNSVGADRQAFRESNQHHTAS